LATSIGLFIDNIIESLIFQIILLITTNFLFGYITVKSIITPVSLMKVYIH
jgi:hypothetical protein